MNRTKAIWSILFLLGGAALCWRAVSPGAGRVYVRAVEVRPQSHDNKAPPKGWTKHVEISPKAREAERGRLSMPRTIGIWIAALLTLCVFSFLYGDNPFYKFAEAVIVGASAAYQMVVGFWSTIVQNLLGKLVPALMRNWAVPGLGEKAAADYFYFIPLILGAMMLWRLSPKGGWISRWPLAFFIGATAGFKLISHLQVDFVAQLSASVLPLIVVDAGRLDFWASLKNITIVGGTLCCLTYFFFSIEHKGALGKISKVGIWVLMITFGAGFGYAVMGRITLLAARFEFLFDDWLWLIDLLGRRQ